MRALGIVFVVAACGSPETVATPPRPARPTAIAAVPAPTCAADVPAAACATGVHACASGEGAWRYALVGGAYEVTDDVTLATLAKAWRAGEVRASDETAAVLAARLGPRGAIRADAAWSIVPAHELRPTRMVITVDGQHPLTSDTSPLTVALCGTAVHNIDRV